MVVKKCHPGILDAGVGGQDKGGGERVLQAEALG